MKHLQSLVGLSPKFAARFKFIKHKVLKALGGAVGHRRIEDGEGVKHKRHTALKFRM